MSGDTGASMRLNGAVQHSQRNVWNDDFDHRDLGTATLFPTVSIM